MKGAAVAREHQPIRSDLGWSTTDRITVRGLDVANEIIGHFNLGDMAFLEFTGRKPTPAESKLFNAVTVTLVEHGITPSSIAARMTIAGAPEALQAAVAAGLCGLGSVFVGSMEHAAVMLEQALPYGTDHSSADLVQLAAEIVDPYPGEKRILPRLGPHTPQAGRSWRAAPFCDRRRDRIQRPLRRSDEVHSCARRSCVGPHDADKCDWRNRRACLRVGLPAAQHAWSWRTRARDRAGRPYHGRVGTTDGGGNLASCR